MVTPHVEDLPDSDPQTGILPTPAELLAEYEERNPEVREQIEATEGEGFEPESLTQVVTLVPELKVRAAGAAERLEDPARVRLPSG